MIEILILGFLFALGLHVFAGSDQKKSAPYGNLSPNEYAFHVSKIGPGWIVGDIDNFANELASKNIKIWLSGCFVPDEKGLDDYALQLQQVGINTMRSMIEKGAVTIKEINRHTNYGYYARVFAAGKCVNDALMAQGFDVKIKKKRPEMQQINDIPVMPPGQMLHGNNPMIGNNYAHPQGFAQSIYR